MREYRSHKTVQAARIVGIDAFAETGPDEPAGYWLTLDGAESEAVDDEWLGKHSDGKGEEVLIGGYFVRYADGYESWSPAEAFEAGYTAIDTGVQP